MKATPQKAKGRVARQSDEADAGALNDETEAPASVAGDSLAQNEGEHKVSEETTKVENSEANTTVAPIESKPASAPQEIPKETPKVAVTEKKKPTLTTNDSKTPVKTESSSPAVQKEECKKDEPNQPSKPVEKPKEPAHSTPSVVSVPPSEPAKEKPVEPVAQQNESKAENNNLSPTLKPVSSLIANEQPNKTVEQAAPVESKLENDSAPEKKEAQTA